MGVHDRLQRDMAWVLVGRFKTQEALAAALHERLGLDPETDLRTRVSRFLNREVDKSSCFAPIYLVFWREVACDHYPLEWMGWWYRAYSSYDLSDKEDPLGNRNMCGVRTLLAEARELFAKADPVQAAVYSKHEDYREFMQGVAAALKQRALKTGGAGVHQGIEHLQKAIRLFSSRRSGSEALSDCDRFHIAYALQLLDWLISELPDNKELREKTLLSMRDLGALQAYEWLCARTHDWQHRYNLAEMWGVVSNALLRHSPTNGATSACVNSLTRSIELNPRLADFDAETKFDGVDEPLSKAAALQRAIQLLKREKGEWLAKYVTVYRRHFELYKKDVTKGIKDMLSDLKSAKAEPALAEATNNQNSTKLEPTLTMVGGAVLAVVVFLMNYGAIAKPIF
jgi:hypothetical protein